MRQLEGKPLSAAPGPRTVPFFGNVLAAWRDPIGLLIGSARAYGEVVRFRFGPHSYVMLNAPEDIHHVLVERPRAYAKSRGYEGMKLVLGGGLLTSEGDHWRKQRKLMQPAFHHERLRQFGVTMTTFTREMLEHWRASDAPFDLHGEMMRLTFRVVGATLFGADLAGDADEFRAALDVALRFADEYVQQVVQTPLWLPTPRVRRFKRALAVLDRLVYRMIGERRKSGRHGDDLLGMLLAATDETSGGTMSDRELRDEVMTLLLAGHETTANALTWAIYLLAQHPAEAERLHANPERVELVVLEAMRLYPPAWVFERVAVEDDLVGGYAIPKGTTAIMAPYVLHRSPKYWDDPERFVPDRFAPDRAAARSKLVYLPFGDGPRVCIGKGFAMMEAKILLGEMARACRFELATAKPIGLDPGITLRPSSPVMIRARFGRPG